MSARKSSHGTIFLIVSSGSPLALIASSLRSISKKPVCPMTRSLHPPMAHCNQRVRFAATWREEFFEVPEYVSYVAHDVRIGAERRHDALLRRVNVLAPVDDNVGEVGIILRLQVIAERRCVARSLAVGTVTDMAIGVIAVES